MEFNWDLSEAQVRYSFDDSDDLFFLDEILLFPGYQLFNKRNLT